MALKIYDTLVPQGDYPAVTAENVEMSDGTRLSNWAPPASDTAGVKTVNGVSPDENGNVDTAAPTDEQVRAATLEYLEEHPVASGFSDTARALLIAILRAGVYTSDQSANISALELVLAQSATEDGGSGDDTGDSGDGGETGIFTVNSSLPNVTSNNAAVSVTEGESYHATLTAADGYALRVVIVTMGGEAVINECYTDDTNTIYSVSLPNVTGDIVIVATAGAISGGDSGETEEITFTQTGTVLMIDGVDGITSITKSGTVLSLT